MMMPLLLTLALATGAPLTLDEALAKAKANPRVLQSEAAIRQQKQRVDEARAGYYPSANAQLGVAVGSTRPTSSTGVEAGTSTNVGVGAGINAGLTANQMLWDFGRTKANVSAAESNVEATKRDGEGILLDVELTVRAAYFAALSAEALAQAAGENTAAQQKHVQQAQVQADVGRRPLYDVTKAKLDLANAKMTQASAETAVRSARADLSHAVGEDVSEAKLVDPAGTAKPALALEAAVSQAISHRPEIAEQDARIAAQRSVLELAHRQYYPSLGMGGQLGYRGGTTWSLGPTLAIPILSGGADEARIGEQSAALEGLQRARDALVLDIRQDVEKQLLAVKEARDRAALAGEVIAQARETVRLAEGRYEAGAGTIVELADAQAALAQALAQEIKAKLDASVAEARLARSIGG